MPTLQSISSLAEIPGLEGLQDVCREFHIELTGTGPTIRRLASALIANPKAEIPRLTDLAPFMSTIDLMHNGSFEQTAYITSAIHQVVPFAEFFRWNISSWYSVRGYFGDAEYAPVVPANCLELGSLDAIGIRDRYNGISDLRSGKFRFEPQHPEERRSYAGWGPERPLDQAFAFMQILLEELPMRFGPSASKFLPEQPGLKACIPFLRKSMELIVGTNNQPVGSRHRVEAENRYLELFSSATDAALWREMWSLVLEGKFGFDEGSLRTEEWRWLPSSLEHPDTGGFASSASSLRFPDPRISAKSTGEVLTGSAAIKKGILPLFSENDLPEIAPGQDVIGSSEAIFLRLCPDKSNLHPGWIDREKEHDEFLYFQLPFFGDPARVQTAGALIELDRVASPHPKGSYSSQGEHRACLFALPSDVRLKRVRDGDGEVGSNDMLQIRLNCGRLLDGIAGIASAAEDPEYCSWRLKVHVLAGSEKPPAPEIVWEITE